MIKLNLHHTMHTLFTLRKISLLGALLFASLTASADVPQLINYQGRVAVGSVNFDGTGQFKFALVNDSGSTTFWSNDGTSNAGAEPTAAVSLSVTKGLYSVQLGDLGLANMQAVPASVFNNSDVRLRVWFNHGVNDFQLLSPDQRLTTVGYAMTAASLQSGSAISGTSGTFSDVVRVGTPTESATLTVQTGGYGILHTDGDKTFSTYIDANGVEIGTVSNHPFGFFTNDSSYQMVIYPTGEVGIGTNPTSTPTAKLEVVGSVKATSFIGNGAALTGVSAGVFGQNTNQAVAGTGRAGTVGEIILSAGNIANGIPCSGQTLSIATYPDLYSLLGVTYGGDGITTFGLPDLRNAAPNGLTYSILANGILPTTAP